MRRKILLILAILLMPLAAWAQSSLTLPRTGEEAGTVPLFKVLEEAYAHIGIELTYIDVPNERALAGANDGTYDGEPFRVAGLEAKFPNLIPIEVPLMEANVVAISKTSAAAVASPADLRGSKIVIIRGRQVAMAITRGQNVTMVGSPDQALKMLDTGRADIYVEIAGYANEPTERLGLSGTLKTHEPPLMTITSYHYLHKKNGNLVPSLTVALQEMKDSGRILEIMRQQ
jgi:polar amino acid transport system substrate-binding protein